MAKAKEKPNDFGKLWEACKEASLDAQIHMYGSGKKAYLQIEVYKTGKDEQSVDKEAVNPSEKPEAAAKRLHKRMADNGLFG